MINVSAQTKSAWKNETVLHYLSITIGETTYTDEDDILNESLEISEVLESNEYLQFTGCSSSKATFTLLGISNNLKGEPVTITIQAGNTEVIPLFHGYVDSQSTKDYTTGTCEFVCYDVLYSLSSVDVATWYKNLFDNTENITIGDFRTALFTQIGLTAETVSLPNDNVVIKKEYSPQQLCALDLIKNICQINGVFGIINRSGNFEFRTLKKVTEPDAIVDTIEYYKSLDYQRFTAQGVQRVLVRQNEDDPGRWSGVSANSNTFIIQGNFFTIGVDDTTKGNISLFVYNHIADRSYVPYSAEIEGYPWLEVGDIVTYNVYDYVNDTTTPMQFYIMARSLKGIQALMDTQSADGDKDRSIFVSDTHTQIDTIKQQIESIQGKLSSMSLQYVNFYNEDEKVIGDGETRPIVSNTFSVMSPCQVRFDLEYLLQCETTETDGTTYDNDDLTVTVFYELDGTIIDSRTPKETYQDGDHILSTYYIVNVPDMQSHTWRVLLKCEGGEVTIPQLQAMNTLLGLGSIVEANWDGTIEAEDVVSAISFSPFTIGEFTDSATTTTQQPTTPSGIGDTFNAISFTPFSIGAFTDSAGIDEVVEYYILDTTSTVTCDTDYVKTSGGKFELQTTYVYNGTEIQTIDSGTLFVVEIDDSADYSSLTDLEIE